MRTSKHPQRGSILILGALAISIGVIILASIDIGLMYWDKREYQKAADLAALAGAKTLAEQTNAGTTDPAIACTAANSTAQATAQSNLHGRPFASLTAITPATAAGGNCGLWLPFDKVDNRIAKARPNCVSGSTDPRIAKPLDNERSNAVRAVIHGTRKHWLLPGESTPLTACAVAATTPSAQAQLKIRSTLATVEDGAVNALLGALTGSSAALNVGGWQGVANADINLLPFLGDVLNINVDADIGTFEELISTEKISVGALLEAAIRAVGSDTPADGTLSAFLGALPLGIPNLEIPLGALLNLQTGAEKAGLDTAINAFELVRAVIQVANKKHALSVDGVNVGNLVGVKVSVIEPAQVSAIGNPRLIGANPKTDNPIYVRTGQVRALASVNLKALAAIKKFPYWGL